jgi:hypothetical protein
VVKTTEDLMSGCTQLQPACGRAFQDIAVQYATLAERTAAMDTRLEAISKAVIGNGNPKDSLLARMERVESSAEVTRRAGERFWKVFGLVVAVASVVVAALK